MPKENQSKEERAVEAGLNSDATWKQIYAAEKVQEERRARMTLWQRLWKRIFG